jgi:hypothetical protein
MAEKTSRWAPVPDRSQEERIDVDGVSFDCSEDELHAAESIRHIVAIAGKNRGAAIRIFLTPLLSFARANGLGVELLVKTLRYAYDHPSEKEEKAVQ